MNMPMQPEIPIAEHQQILPVAAPEFNENLAPQIPDAVLEKAGKEISDLVAADMAAGKKRRDLYDRGMKMLNSTDQDVVTDADKKSKNLSTVRLNPLTASCNEIVSQLLPYFFPADGGVKATPIGEDETGELEAQAERAAAYMNYQYCREMPNYFVDCDETLFELVWSGTVVRKVYHDARLSMNVVRKIPAADICANADALDLDDATRITWTISMTRNEFNALVAQGFYSPVEKLAELESAAAPLKRHPGYDDANKSLDAAAANINNDKTVTLQEVHISYPFEGLDGIGDSGESKNQVIPPYIVTYEESSKTIVSVRRNWRPGDPRMLRRNYFVAFKFQPGGQGIYGRGLFEECGGSAKAATALMRNFIDNLNLSSMFSGLVKKGAIEGSLEAFPGHFNEVNVEGGDIAKNFMLFPTQPPNPVTLETMQYLSEEVVKGYARATDLFKDMTPSNMAPGSIRMVLTEANKSFSALMRRITEPLAKQHRMLAELNAEFLPETWQFAVSGEAHLVSNADFDNRVDIDIQTDSLMFSKEMEFAKGMDLLTFVQAFPDRVDTDVAAREVSKLWDFDKIPGLIPEPPAAPEPYDPVTENAMIMRGEPVMAYIQQEHRAHIQVHIAQFTDPTILASPATQAVLPQAISHLQEHLTWEAMIQTATAAGIDASLIASGQVPPEAHDEIAARAAQALADNPVIQQIEAMQKISEDPEAIAAEKIAEATIDLKRGETQAEIENRQLLADQKVSEENQLLAAKIRTMLVTAQAKSNIDQGQAVEQIAQSIDEHEEELRQLREKHAIELEQLRRKKPAD